MDNIKVVIFDLDDTLISEKQFVRSGFKHVSKIISNEYNLDNEYVYSYLLELFNHNSKNIFNRLLDKIGFSYSDELISFLVYEYRTHKPDIYFYEDVVHNIKKLRNNNVKVGMITDGFHETQRQKIEVINAKTYFDEIIVTDELGEGFWKPHPKAFEIMKELFEVDFEEMLYVGDNPDKDFFISKIHPITTMRILRSEGVYMDDNYLKNVREDVRIKNLNELTSCIIKE
ncbi:HAD-IA family hydrolase [Alkalibacillus salilacus]|uniref:Hydrolase of the HAD superfamily n=1 Tax=Alkalibacillus salilacus TaxID=284582 RepID=A0ABT9VI87_9BACI|nr:HAD-IA family hydrolase [Alkalibacillus salilacus]MDQ0160550.1 putative hydrolase of the HAD superfamily [Alkalibacillus salilacus]